MQADRYRLFDLARDPGESRDVQQEHEAIATRMRGDLQSWIRHEAAHAAAPAAVEMTEEERERLRSLGYLQ
jgi:hypothetical protein